MRSHCLTSVVKRPAHRRSQSSRSAYEAHAKFITRYHVLNSYRTPLPGSRSSLSGTNGRRIWQAAERDRSRRGHPPDYSVLLHANVKPNVSPTGPAAGKCLILIHHFFLLSTITWFLGDQCSVRSDANDGVGGVDGVCVYVGGCGQCPQRQC